MKSGVPRVNSYMVFMCIMYVLSAKIFSRPVTALINVTETGIFVVNI